MDDSTRRDFLTKGSWGLAAAGLAIASPALLPGGRAQAAEPTPAAPAVLEGPLVAYLRDADTGTFSLLVGEREVHFTDRALAARLTHAAR
jgi:hypothetical protein